MEDKLRALIIFVLLFSISLFSACTGKTTITYTITQTQEETRTITQVNTITLPAKTITEITTITETLTLPVTTITQTSTVMPLSPRLIWVEKTGSVVDYDYSAGILTGCTVYQYFEVSDGSGEVEITAIIGDTFGIPFIDNSEITDTFTVEEGGLYRLSIEVSLVAAQPLDPLEIKDSFDIIISSPAAAFSVEITIDVEYFHRVSLEQMTLEPWQ